MDAQLQTAYLPPVGAAVQTVRVLRNSKPVVVLTSVAHGSAFTVTADHAGSTAVRPYTFATAAETNAFLTDSATSFAYLGCDVEHA